MLQFLTFLLEADREMMKIEKWGCGEKIEPVGVPSRSRIEMSH